MDPNITLLVIIGYFVLLFVISVVTSRNADGNTFFKANRNSPWYVVAFGMVGATLSGVTFISVPGAVGNGQWAYMQMVFGYLLGYFVIATVLLPLYYRMNLTSIYGYLDQRYGLKSYRSGAILFLVSRVIQASLRLYLVAMVLQLAIFDHFQIPFPVTVLLSIGLIYLYTFRGGIKTVVWTDTLQTFLLLLAAGITVYTIGSQLDLSFGEITSRIADSKYSEVFYWDFAPGNNFFKQFFSGAFMAIVMTGLDQDMMQKNLTCRSLGDAQKNMFWFSIALVVANLLFLSMGALLYIYGAEMNIVQEVFSETCKIKVLDPESGEMICRATDQLFPLLSLDYLGPGTAIIFVLGIIAAAYSSADSALTALTTSFCVDILDFEKKTDEEKKRKTRYLVHVGFAALLFLVIIIFKAVSDDAVIWEIFRAAGYTYGPLLGLYAFGLFTKRKAQDKMIPWICVASPVLSYVIAKITPMVMNYEFGFEILILNGIITIIGLFIFSEEE